MSAPVADAAPPHTLLRPAIALPFLLVALLWGSTWYVITTQIGDVPAPWAVTYRFMLATPAMFALAAWRAKVLAMPRRAHMLALAIGLFQFCGNFNLVYLSELHLTSGIVALLIGMMLVPNAIFGRFLLGQPITARFVLGSAIALAGIAALLVNEAREAPLGGNIPLGTVLALLAMLSASFANVIQARPSGKDVPLLTLLAWSMLYGTGLDAALAFVLTGPPVMPDQSIFWAGTAWLALAGSVGTFPIYYDLVRKLGAGRAAYNGVLVIVIAMAVSTVLEGYRWSPLAVAGGALAMVGLLVALRGRQMAVKAGS
ncbi:DMT family transporter [Paraurantiacibacter namhicola]|uniref:Putative DMT superfamily transporter inner membrane protein n=1 Tax=Paraurantiacibacter namhicola TaxID=645517 RepID=A0A1C7D5C1_9SPHN|nr:DMT family transporter [Paraurantiacibacter namhicola]ANU06660.1 putative DMT superfamily transporter inner membrane protein [Paraurantiacibacter namhicola]